MTGIKHDLHPTRPFFTAALTAVERVMPGRKFIEEFYFDRALQGRRDAIVDRLFKAFSGKVQNGPFRGMHLTERSSWGSGLVASELLGCYEAQLHPYLEHAIQRGYRTVIDVGCCDGYYAVGLSSRLPSARVFAFDINLPMLRIYAAVMRS